VPLKKMEAIPWQSSDNHPPYRFGDCVAVQSTSRLWTIGNRSILNRSLLGFFCSRRCPGDAILRTYDLARGLRDAGIPVIGGFHSPMEKECLDLLLRGRQPIVICPARSIEHLQIPSAWREPLENDRLLVVSQFSPNVLRPTAKLADRRNHLVAEIASAVFVAHAADGGMTAQFCASLREKGKPVWTFDSAANEALHQTGVCRFSVQEVITQAERHCGLDMNWSPGPPQMP
jgi:predicted Rossmann fold nucleotide-binding protein DprA/Smf involved in DNA uptake